MTKEEREVMQMALGFVASISPAFICEATHHKKNEEHASNEPCPHVKKQKQTYEAIKEALANDALEKKAENARELGLMPYNGGDYEPVAIHDCGEAGHADGACGNRECLPSFRRNTTQPQQDKNEFKPDWDEKLALTEEVIRLSKRIEELEAQTEQEPVAFVKGCNRGQWEIFPAKAYQIFEREQPLYTSPPQRKPLSDEERLAIRTKWMGGNWTCGDIIDAVEAAHGIKGEA